MSNTYIDFLASLHVELLKCGPQRTINKFYQQVYKCQELKSSSFSEGRQCQYKVAAPNIPLLYCALCVLNVDQEGDETDDLTEWLLKDKQPGKGVQIGMYSPTHKLVLPMFDCAYNT